MNKKIPLLKISFFLAHITIFINSIGIYWYLLKYTFMILNIFIYNLFKKSFTSCITINIY